MIFCCLGRFTVFLPRYQQHRLFDIINTFCFSHPRCLSGTGRTPLLRRTSSLSVGRSFGAAVCRNGISSRRFFYGNNAFLTVINFYLPFLKNNRFGAGGRLCRRFRLTDFANADSGLLTASTFSFVSCTKSKNSVNASPEISACSAP